MVNGVTKSGFEFVITDDALDDYELLEALCDIDNGDMGQVPKMVERLLGRDQKNALKAHIKAIKGKVSSKAMIEEISDIFAASNEGKNS